MSENANPSPRVGVADEATRQWVLERMPQKEPFLFIDSILELSEHHIVAQRRYRPDEYFFAGHFPGDPITPGVILIETMAQAALVAQGIYVVSRERPGVNMRSLFSDCEIEFCEIVRPGDLVTVYGERVYWRRNKMQAQIELKLENGKIAACGKISGFGVEM